MMPAGIFQSLDDIEAFWLDVDNPAGRDGGESIYQLECLPHQLAELCSYLFSERHYRFGGLIVEQRTCWELRYIFYQENSKGWLHVLVKLPSGESHVPTIARLIHAADWHEREAQDLFGLNFDGHPRTGNFVLHNELRESEAAPMRKSFDASLRVLSLESNVKSAPRRIVSEYGSFAMPIGPIYSVAVAPVHFQLETVGEDVIRAQPRLFYTYRGLEKIAEGRGADNVLLLAERISGTSAFAHSLAFCQAVEQACRIKVPDRALALRVFVSELERLRHHVAAIEAICESTALTVAAAQAAILEEDLLRISAVLTGHRYLFGLNTFGGLTIDLDNGVCKHSAARAGEVARGLDNLHKMLRVTSSFLDRLEGVGAVSKDEATDFGLVGPIARASGIASDLRKTHPYAAYGQVQFQVPVGTQGNGYSRLRIFFREAAQSAEIIEALANHLPPGRYRVPEVSLRAGASLGWVEAPRGAALHWVRLDENGIVERYKIVTPSFANWHGFRLAAENFAFQDFPIILATFALSVHENDR